MRCLTIAVMILGNAVRVLAQPGEGPPAPERNEFASTASYLHTSFEADEALNKAEKHIQSGRWSSAVSAYQAIGEKYSDYLIAFDENRHVNIRRYVNERIARWPAEGLGAYRAAFGKAADVALTEARRKTDFKTLVKIADTYYATRAGALALDAAAELAIEQGDFQSARQWYALLLASHPDRAEFEHLWRTKLALCSAWLGNLAPLVELDTTFPKQAPGPLVDWGDRERSLGDFVRDMLEELETQNSEKTTPAALSSSSIFCGNTNRQAFFHTTAIPEARLWQFSHFDKVRQADGDEDLDFHVDRRNTMIRLLQSGRLLTSAPVFGHGLLYYHDARMVWAVDPEDTTSPVWQFDRSSSQSKETPWISEDEPPDQFTSLLADNRLYIHLDHRAPKSDVDDTRKMSMLVCLDAKTGRLIWKNSFDAIASKFEDLRLDGAPILHRGQLFTVARRRKAFGFESCLLLCLDPKSGQLRWHTHVGEAATGSYGYYRPTRTHPAASGDLVFAHTNLGTIAAVSATTGRVIWLRRYRSKTTDEVESAWPTRFGRPIRSWQYQPSMVWRDAVLCMPLDLDQILVLDQNDGDLRKQLPLDKLSNPETILGLHGNLLFTVGSHVTCYDLADDKIAWQRPLIEGQLFGRGSVTNNGLLVPTDRALLHYPLDGGPAQIHAWKLEDAGNVLPLSDQIVVASAKAHYALVSKKDAFVRLTGRMKARPDDHEAALAVADLAFTTGEYDRGLSAVEQAVSRLGGFARIGGDETRRRLFDRLSRFSEELVSQQISTIEAQSADPNHKKPAGPASTQAPEDARLATAVRLLTMAGQCAVEVKEQIVYRLALARAELYRERPTAAVGVYQQILRDRSLRRIKLEVRAELYPPHQKTTSEPIRPGIAIAIPIEAWVDQLISQHGRDIYADVERQARNRFKIARADSNLSEILEVAEAFPNSLTAVNALIDHARRSAKQNHWAKALRSYRRALTGADDNLRPTLLHEFTVCLLNAGQSEEADQWLQRGIRDYPSLRFEHDGRSIGFETLRRVLLGDQRFRHVAHPDMTWPTNEVYQRLFSDHVVVLNPRFDDLPDTQWDAIITHSNGQLEARSPATGRDLWPRSVDCPTEPILLGMDKGRFVFATAHRLFALTRTSGQLAWQFGDEPPDDPDTDPESFAAWPYHAMTVRHLFSTSERGDLICIDLQDGNLRWRRETGGGAANHLAADDRHLFFTQWQGRRNVVHIVDAQTGEPVHTVEPQEAHPWQALVPAPSGTLLAVRSRSILSIDANQGEIRWQIDTPENFLLSTLNVNADGVFVSDDGRRLTKYDLHSSKKQWQSPPIGTDSRDGLWAELVGGRLLAASRNAFIAFDTADGRELWRVRNPPGLRLQPPVIVDDAVLAVSSVKPNVKAPGASRLPPLKPPGTKSYQVHRFALSDGKEKRVVEDGPLLTEPFESFGGLFVRNQCLLLLDGHRLIGYVGDESSD
ncbi:MAG: PQQ-binding-like beta-propeller repeat protein [Phycisphaerales bacterium]|nr:PQQ-binding-like beta-propeller repeat protein [Phycisphaerales bacterium]